MYVDSSRFLHLFLRNIFISQKNEKICFGRKINWKKQNESDRTQSDTDRLALEGEDVWSAEPGQGQDATEPTHI